MSSEDFWLAVVLMLAAFIGLSPWGSATLGLDGDGIAGNGERPPSLIQEAPPRVPKLTVPVGVYAE
jgi:hypothetical protein